jgi:hypothetical protein
MSHTFHFHSRPFGVVVITFPLHYCPCISRETEATEKVTCSIQVMVNFCSSMMSRPHCVPHRRRWCHRWLLLRATAVCRQLMAQRVATSYSTYFYICGNCYSTFFGYHREQSCPTLARSDKSLAGLLLRLGRSRRFHLNKCQHCSAPTRQECPKAGRTPTSRCRGRVTMVHLATKDAYQLWFGTMTASRVQGGAISSTRLLSGQ